MEQWYIYMCLSVWMCVCVCVCVCVFVYILQGIIATIFSVDCLFVFVSLKSTAPLQ